MLTPLILGCSGSELTDVERCFFKETEPLGFILFQRNCKNRKQVKKLVCELRDSVGRHAPVLIDQEGGRVQRLKPPEWSRYIASKTFGEILKIDHCTASRLAMINAQLIAEDLFELGVNINCAPVLDLREEGGHAIIGDRALSNEPEAVRLLGQAIIDGFAAVGVASVIKHIPGHGRAKLDSHYALPSIDTEINKLIERDFYPFKHVENAYAAMTGHLLFSKIDPLNPVTFSKKVICEVIRGHMDFDDLLISDDLSMNALNGDIGERTKRALEAGCDVALHCNGDFSEMQLAAEACSRPHERSIARINRFTAQIEELGKKREAVNVSKLAAELEVGLKALTSKKN